MKELERLQDMICGEIRKINSQNELTPNSLEIANVAVDILKDIMDIYEKEARLNYGGEMSYKNGYSSNYKPLNTTYPNDWSNENHNSYNYGKNMYDSSYSRNTAAEQMIEKLEIMKQSATAQTQSIIQRCIDDLKRQ